MELLGSDKNGITQVSLDNIKKLYEKKYVLENVYIINGDNHEIITCFEFKDEKYYLASGFSIGYAGEGPHGLWKAISMFYPSYIAKDFFQTQISSMDSKIDWRWSPEKGFHLFMWKKATIAKLRM